MKGIVIYDTSHGNTKQIAETITEALKDSGIEVDLFNKLRKSKRKRLQFSGSLALQQNSAP